MKARMGPSYATALNSQSASLTLLAAKPFATFPVDNRSESLFDTNRAAFDGN